LKSLQKKSANPSEASNYPVIGGVLAAIGASICCAGPLVLLLLGISGSWISNLTLFEPYRPIFILLVVAAFGYAGWKLFRAPVVCEPEVSCADPRIRRRRLITFWVAAALALLLVLSNYWIVWLV